MTVPTPQRHLVEVSGAEALWLLEGSTQGRLVHTQRDGVVVRPAVHILEYGRLMVRAPIQAAVVADRTTLTYQVDDIRTVSSTGWTLTVSGPAELVGEPNEADHYRRTLAGWVHGPHDTLIRIHPQTVTGFRLAHGNGTASTGRP